MLQKKNEDVYTTVLKKQSLPVEKSLQLALNVLFS